MGGLKNNKRMKPLKIKSLEEIENLIANKNGYKTFDEFCFRNPAKSYNKILLAKQMYKHQFNADNVKEQLKLQNGIN